VRKKFHHIFQIFLKCYFAIMLSLTVHASEALARGTAYVGAEDHTISASKERIAQILSVIESRIGDRHLIGKVHDKLNTLSDGDLRLIGSLCSRIERESGGAGAELALSLVMALIALS
jgi:hypothetical protein